MGKNERLAIIDQIQQKRNSHVISYVTSTRVGFEVQMAIDSVRKVYDHLQSINLPREEVSVDLFLHSNGGDGTVPWRLVTLIREFAGRFSVLVPYKAFSAATLTALGADEIVMHRMGVLGPTDPTVVNPFNPHDPATNERIGIGVEDVTAYLALAREDAGIRGDAEMIQAFDRLSSQVHPLALGNVKRSLSQSRMMARKLLLLHMDVNTQASQVDSIVENLTSKLFYHGHPINRFEGQELGLGTLTVPSDDVEALMWALYLDYEEQMLLEKAFRPIDEFLSAYPNPQVNKPSACKPQSAKVVYVESAHRTDVFQVEYELVGWRRDDLQIAVMNSIRGQSWGNE